MKFPKPWKLVQSDPGCKFWVYDANDKKLFHISDDDYGEEKPGEPGGPTVLGDNDDDTNALLDELTEIFARSP
jgi:hypothetical protein